MKIKRIRKEVENGWWLPSRGNTRATLCIRSKHRNIKARYSCLTGILMPHIMTWGIWTQTGLSIFWIIPPVIYNNAELRWEINKPNEGVFTAHKWKYSATEKYKINLFKTKMNGRYCISYEWYIVRAIQGNQKYPYLYLDNRRWKYKKKNIWADGF